MRISRRLERDPAKPLILALSDDGLVSVLLSRYVENCQFAFVDTTSKARSVVENAFPAAVIRDANWKGCPDDLNSTLHLPAHIPVITCPMPSMRQLSVLLGATDYLPKPVTRADLTQAIARLPQSPKSILIVDDNPSIVRLLARMLKAFVPNAAILEVFNGGDALEVIRSQHPDLVLLDLVMPEMSGYELLQEVSQDESLQDIEIIVVSIRSMEQEAAPVHGEMHFQRTAGFSPTEILLVLKAILSTITRPDAVAPTNAAALLEVHPDLQVS